MSQTIWKFQVPTDDSFVLELPKTAKVLTVMVQRDTPYVWVQLDPKQMKVPRTFRTFGTGDRIGDPYTLTYIGSFLLENHSLVFHLYEQN